MKSLFVILLAIIAAEALEGSVRKSVWEKSCEPGKTFKYYCNSCMCTKFGTPGRCTRMMCDETIYNEDGTLKVKDENGKRCEASKAYSTNGCNTCICNEYGTGSLCTRERCSPNSIETYTNKETKEWGPLYKQGDKCPPNELFYSECNQCVCSRNGRKAFCTRVACLNK